MRRLGVLDQVVEWFKPKQKPRWMAKDQFEALPESLIVREMTYQVGRRSFRTKTITLVTTLLDADLYPLEALAELYGIRWRLEVCQADCISRYTLYQARGSAHSERCSVVGAGTMEPDSQAIEPRRTAMRRLNVRLGAPPAQAVMVALSA
jgi:hypothetical protein